jgi:predicted aconitase with swiveling domain
MSSPTLKGRGLVQGRAEGEAVVSLKAFTFAHGVDPATGRVTDVRSDVKGSEVKGKVLFYPFGKGSTTASAWFLEAVRLGNNPVALVTEGVDLSAVIGSVMARLIYEKEIPVVSGLHRSIYSAIISGTNVSVDGATGEVRVSN